MAFTFPLEELFKQADSFQLKKEPVLIGISANHKDGLNCVADTYICSIIKVGGAPVIIPSTSDLRVLTHIVNQLDGLLMSGGGDINPLFLHEEPLPGLQDVDTWRDQSELLLLRLAANRQLPIMGICRGHQLVNIAFGGSLYQDIYSQCEQKLLKHSQKMPREEVSHSVTLEDGNTVYVNSFHHQAVKDIAPDFVEMAIAPDGINEGIRHQEKPVFSVQWHPEAFNPNEDEMTYSLFSYLINKARYFHQAKELHRKYVTLDSHTDTPMLFPGSFNIGKKEGGKVNLPLMEEGLIDATVMVAYIPQKERDEQSLRQATNYALERLSEIHRQKELNDKRMRIAYTYSDVMQAKKHGERAILLGVENGYAIGKDLVNLVRFKEMGVCYITLCHNGDNDICDSAKGNREWNGLSPFGRDVIHEMNRLGIMVDVSHASEKSFYDALEYSQYPIIASHSSVRALCNHPRNLTDMQIRDLASMGGVVQICLYKGFINEEEEKASLSDAINHIDHIVQLVGPDHVGIGSDFDGDGELIGCRASNELLNITMKLLELGYAESDIRKIWGGNFFRVMREVQSVNSNRIKS